MDFFLTANARTIEFRLLSNTTLRRSKCEAKSRNVQKSKVPFLQTVCGDTVVRRYFYVLTATTTSSDHPSFASIFVNKPTFFIVAQSHQLANVRPEESNRLPFSQSFIFVFFTYSDDEPRRVDHHSHRETAEEAIFQRNG